MQALTVRDHPSKLQFKVTVVCVMWLPSVNAFKMLH